MPCGRARVRVFAEDGPGYPDEGVPDTETALRRKKEGGLFLKWETVFLKAEPVGDNLTYPLCAINGKEGRKML